jgi:hypothetical protein
MIAQKPFFDPLKIVIAALLGTIAAILTAVIPYFSGMNAIGVGLGIATGIVISYNVKPKVTLIIGFMIIASVAWTIPHEMRDFTQGFCFLMGLTAAIETWWCDIGFTHMKPEQREKISTATQAAASRVTGSLKKQ